MQTPRHCYVCAAGRNEYNMMLLYTNGEVCDDDMWEFTTSHFETQDNELTFEGFHELHLMKLEQQLEDGGTDDDFYRKVSVIRSTAVYLSTSDVVTLHT